tara:strand:+ start:214 stop:852 length:639 start_codon:yes stop_codon:yes gene_type:complete
MHPTPTPTQHDECGLDITPPSTLDKIDRIRKQANLNKAQDDKFILSLDIPKCVSSGTYGTKRQCDAVDLDDLIVSVFACNTPTINIQAKNLDYSGIAVPVSTHTIDTDPVTVQYFVNNTFTNYWLLWEWMKLISHPTKGFAGDDDLFNLVPKNYQTNMSLYSLDGYNDVVGEWVFTGAFLTTLESVDYNHQSDEEITSSFSFDYSFVNFHLH